MEFLLIILLGIITYFIVKRSVTSITQTPVWLLWFVMMTPALSWSAWILVYGEDESIPLSLIIGPFLLCPLLYWSLIQWGRTNNTTNKQNHSAAAKVKQEEKPPVEETSQLRPITSTEEKQLRNCFPWEVYYLQNLDYRPQAILCRGKLRSNPEIAYSTIESNVKEKFGDRFFVIFQEGLREQPFFALVPNPRFQAQELDKSIYQPTVAVGLLLITLIITTFIGVEVAGFSVQDIATQPEILQSGMHYALALVSIFGIRELSHYLVAIRHHVRTTLPYFIPLPFFPGTFGAFVQKRSPIPNRKVLFDIAITGPMVGYSVSIPILLWGLSLSEVVPIAQSSRLLSFEALDPRFSCLLALISKLALGSQLTAQMAIDLHPLAVAGYVGFALTTLNLLPVGQLDGGQISHAVFGQRTAITIAQVARLLMLILAWIQPDFLILAIVLLFMPIADEPALNDVSQLNNGRDLLGLISLAVLLSVLLPLPGTFAQWLNL